MKKKIFSILLILIITFSLVFITNKNSMFAGTSVTADEIKSIFTEFYADGYYTKNTVINLDSSKIDEELQKYFHRGISTLVRTTHYKDDELWMNSGKGTEYIGYGTSSNGTLTSFAVSVDGVKGKEKISSLPSMEEYYCTLNDFSLGYHNSEQHSNGINLDLTSGWTISEGVYKSTSKDVINGFRLFTAPGLLAASKENANYFDFTEATIEVVDNKLIMKLWVSVNELPQNNEGGKLLSDVEVVGENAVFSEAVVVRDHLVINEYIINPTDGNASYLRTSYEDVEYGKIMTIKSLGYVDYEHPENEYVANNDYVKVDTLNDSYNVDIYYSVVDKWDGASVSSGLQGDGSEGNPYLITSGADLKWLDNNMTATENFGSKYFKMTKSIDLQGQSIKIGAYPGWNNNRRFFKGIYDGNNCSIRNLNMNESGMGAGLFSVVNGTVKNINVYGTVTGDNKMTGSIVGWLYNGKLENSVSYVNVSSTAAESGGVVGVSEGGSIANCIYYGNVTSSGSSLGGVAGKSKSNISNCTNYGSVIGSSGAIGGIVGLNDNNAKTALSNSNNYGLVRGGSWNVGGVVGDTYASVTSCNNYANVSGSFQGVGGIVGEARTDKNIIIKDCVNEGYITGCQNTGGIVGFLRNNTVDSCVNNGNVSAPEKTISGDSTGYNIGGIVGYITNGSIISAINNGSVISYSEVVGGIVGLVANDSTATITNCTNNGLIQCRGNKAGAIVGGLENAASVANESGSVNNGSVYTGVTKLSLNPNKDKITSINHRGYCFEAPENTLSAYRLSKEKGFSYVECDVNFTLDGIPVLLHDNTIDNTSNGSGNIRELTYAEASQYDYSYDAKHPELEAKFEAYRGEKLPTFEEFIVLCKELELHPYIEIKDNPKITAQEAKVLYDIVKKHDMLDNVSWISFDIGALEMIVKLDPTARIGWVLSSLNTDSTKWNHIDKIDRVITGQNEVFIDMGDTGVTEYVVSACHMKGINLEVWCLDKGEEIKLLNLHPYVSGISSNDILLNDLFGDMYEVTVRHLNLDGTLIEETKEQFLEPIYTVYSKEYSGMVPSHDYVMGTNLNDGNTVEIYYSEVDVWDGVTISTSLSGSGTETDPYLIQSAADFAYFASVVTNHNVSGTFTKDHSSREVYTVYSGKYFKMIKSIDLNGNFMKVGISTAWNAYSRFGGVFDGNNCSVRGLLITSADTKRNDALFGNVSGTIKNLSVYGEVYGGGVLNGGIVGFLVGGTVENCTSYVNIEGSNETGGIVGNLSSNGKVINCVNYGNVKCSGASAGAIVGKNDGQNTISNCVSYTELTK